MKLSTKVRYSVRAMFELALYYGEGPISLKTIAENEGLSEQYLEQLIAILRRAELVKSVRGAQGGYMLSLPPDKITVGDVIRTLEGSLAPADCVIEDVPFECNRADKCPTKIVMEKIRDSINKVIDSITLQDMLEDYKKTDQKNAFIL
ncbi:Rrf2 family transcriptional regulator [Aceticella autotrophica]|uniref:Rrf2 family transcriptional regulator n=1 Tax=Aceticella autotrophica TaxID=2755338 RepID=A0A974Y2T5_9THEO|nr:Rrf2 family transcriptional regulator [Aceticella autotrophica]MDI6604148.1 Rrf2 family transcriptional regulator [Thermoanaerobacteraceae bacterium]QSZ26554.1 Rrf2 family transcriptional regulator [Aceticella autotrophica]